MLVSWFRVPAVARNGQAEVSHNSIESCHSVKGHVAEIYLGFNGKFYSQAEILPEGKSKDIGRYAFTQRRRVDSCFHGNDGAQWPVANIR